MYDDAKLFQRFINMVKTYCHRYRISLLKPVSLVEIAWVCKRLGRVVMSYAVGYYY